MNFLIELTPSDAQCCRCNSPSRSSSWAASWTEQATRSWGPKRCLFSPWTRMYLAAQPHSTPSSARSNGRSQVVAGKPCCPTCLDQQGCDGDFFPIPASKQGPGAMPLPLSRARFFSRCELLHISYDPCLQGKRGWEVEDSTARAGFTVREFQGVERAHSEVPRRRVMSVGRPALGPENLPEWTPSAESRLRASTTNHRSSCVILLGRSPTAGAKNQPDLGRPGVRSLPDRSDQAWSNQWTRGGRGRGRGGPWEGQGKIRRGRWRGKSAWHADESARRRFRGLALAANDSDFHHDVLRCQVCRWRDAVQSELHVTQIVRFLIWDRLLGIGSSPDRPHGGEKPLARDVNRGRINTQRRRSAPSSLVPGPTLVTLTNNPDINNITS